jgi:tripartite-type tricarboxylate transporter receptor subunit TctC
MKTRDACRVLSALFSTLLFWTPWAAAQTFPAKPVEIIVPFTAGGSTDLGARVMAEALQRKWGVPVRVVNKPGGNTVPAVDSVRTSPPDGYTVLMDGSPSSSLLTVAVKNLPFDVLDRSFISMTFQTAMIFIVPAQSPAKTLDDLVAAMKKDPSKFTWGSLGGTGTIDMAFRQLFKAAGVDVAATRAVVSRGGSEAATQVAGGHVAVGAGSYSSISTFVKSGNVRAIAIAAPERSRIAPEIQTTKEAGYPTVKVVQWNGFSGPPKMSQDVISRWRAAVHEALREPKVIEGLARTGMEPYIADGAEMQKTIRSDVEELKILFGR